MSDSPPVVIRGIPDPNEPEAIEFYKLLGICISDWAHIDRRLYELFHQATGMTERQSAFAYYRQRAFNQRLRLVDDALKSFVSRTNFDGHWRPLYAKALELSRTRNIFAHHPVKRLGTSIDRQPVYVYSIYIEPYERIFNNEYPGLKGKTQLELSDLKQHELDLQELEKQLRWFIHGPHFVGSDQQT